MYAMFEVRVSARLLLLLRCLLIVVCIPWMSRRSLDTASRPWMYYCSLPLPSTSPSVPGTRARRRRWLACSRYVFLPICCFCCVTSSPLYVSPGCLDAHWTRPFVPGCPTVACRCLQPRPVWVDCQPERQLMQELRPKLQQPESPAAQLHQLHSFVRTTFPPPGDVGVGACSSAPRPPGRQATTMSRRRVDDE